MLRRLDLLLIVIVSLLGVKAHGHRWPDRRLDCFVGDGDLAGVGIDLIHDTHTAT